MQKNNLRNYTKQSRGIGDTIAKFTSFTGIDKLAHKAATTVGKKGCGCGAR